MTENQIFCCDCLAGMAKMSDACIPLTVTSPPYGTMREYGGHGWDFPAVAKELQWTPKTGPRVELPCGELRPWSSKGDANE